MTISSLKGSRMVIALGGPEVTYGQKFMVGSYRNECAAG